MPRRGLRQSESAALSHLNHFSAMLAYRNLHGFASGDPARIINEMPALAREAFDHFADRRGVEVEGVYRQQSERED